MHNYSEFKNGKLAWKFVDFPKIDEPSGVLSVLEYGAEIDFLPKRLFFLRDIDSSSSRGFHAHKKLKQVLFCAQGSFTLELDNGLERQTIYLDQNSPALFIDGKVWREMHSFTKDAVMMVLCDREYRFDSVIRDYQEFKKNINGKL
jgi:dTDP-4-dehydrorhamnose 3,5-epimerase-like enzyme